jgi:hypothetical protein
MFGSFECTTIVARALDPRVHPLRVEHLAKGMDCRVKPGNDDAQSTT